MLCVTISDRIVRKTSRPISTGRQTLTNASSPTKARSPTVSTAHGSRCPPPPNRIDLPAQMPAPRNARRQASSRSAPNWLEAPMATISSQRTVARGPISTPSSITTCGATTSVPSPRTTSSPIWAPFPLRVEIFSSRRESAEGVRVGAKRLEKVWVERPCLLVELERRGERDVLGRDTGERRSSFRRGSRLLAGDELLDVLLGDEAPLLDRREIDSVPLCELGGLAGRLAIRRSRLRCRLLALGVLLERRRARQRSRRRRRPSCRARPRRPPRRAGRSFRRPGASTSTVAFVVSTTQTGCPCATSARSSTSHSESSANSVFASSRVRTISSTPYCLTPSRATIASTTS